MTTDRYFELRGLQHEILNTHFIKEKTHYLYKISDSTLQHPYYAIITTDLNGNIIDFIPYITDVTEARARFSDL